MANKQVAPYYTQAGLAEKAGLTRHAVAKAIERGQIGVHLTLDDSPLIPRLEAERWLRERRAPGRPPAADPATQKGRG